MKKLVVRNPVAKNSRKFNKARIHKDRKKELARGKERNYRVQRDITDFL